MPCDHDHCTFGDMLGDALVDGIEAGDSVPFGFGLAVAFAVFETAGGGKGKVGDCGSGLCGADLGIVADEADESD